MNQWQNFIGVLLPPIIDLINVWIPNSKLRFIVSILLCFGIGYLAHFGEIKTFEDFFAKGGIIFSEAQIIYALYWQKSEPREALVNKMVGEDK